MNTETMRPCTRRWSPWIVLMALLFRSVVCRVLLVEVRFDLVGIARVLILLHSVADGDIMYTVVDKVFSKSRILKINTASFPYMIEEEIFITDPDEKIALVDSVTIVYDDDTVALDPEGIVMAPDGGFWIVSEGIVGGEASLFVKTDATGKITYARALPSAVEAIKKKHGLEGIAMYDGEIILAFQREWEGEENPRIGIYDIAEDKFRFVFYPLDEPESLNGGWTGLADIVSIGDGKFLVVERDNQRKSCVVVAE